MMPPGRGRLQASVRVRGAEILDGDQKRPKQQEMATTRVAEPMTASTTIIGNSDFGQNTPGLSAHARRRGA
jgi:hypothetical protein